MMKKITARMIMSKGGCYDLTTLDGINSKTSWTLLEWMNYKHYKDGADDAIWIFSRMIDSEIARRFAIWCAKRCKTEVPEIKDYIKVIEGHYLNGTHTYDEVVVAGWAAYWAVPWEACMEVGWESRQAPYWAPYWAADKAAYWEADEAAYLAAEWVADWAADTAKERKAQLNKIKRMLKVA